MKSILPLAVAGLLLSTIAVHPQPGQPEAFGPPPPYAPAAEDVPPRRMICIIDTPFPDHREHCPTHAGYPGSPCRCEGALFGGVRDYAD